jgi:tetratricopeptide (TPR) repeat protein
VTANTYYRYILRDFPDSPLLPRLLTTVEKFEQSDAYKKGLSNWKRIHDEELLKREKYQKAFNDITKNNAMSDSILRWWKSEINSLDSKTGKHGNSDSLMAYRLLNLITIASVEFGNKFITIGSYKVAAEFFTVWTICEPDKKNSWFNLARAYAFDGQSDRATTALEKSIMNGLSNKEIIIKDPAFANILSDKRFKKLIIKL